MQFVNKSENMSDLRSILSNPALKDHEATTRNEEWNNFMHRVTEVSSIVKDLASGDESKADVAKSLADKYLGGKVIHDDLKMEVKSDRTVINEKAFKNVEDASGVVNKEAWMVEMGKDADRRALDRKIRREKADTFKTLAIKAFRREEYDKALSCYNKAIEQTRDNPMFYCDRALTNIKLGRFEKVFHDCDMALRLNEKSFKARLYQAKAHKELEDMGKLEEARKELDEMFPQHKDLIEYFLDKQVDNEGSGDEVKYF